MANPVEVVGEEEITPGAGVTDVRNDKPTFKNIYQINVGCCRGCFIQLQKTYLHNLKLIGLISHIFSLAHK